ncbi:MAG: glycosyltransferase family 4 protein [Ignavibacteriaceae bacterium]
MITGIETSSMGNKYTGTSRYLTCFLEQLEKTPNQIVKFNSDVQFDRNGLAGRINKIRYRNYLLKDKINNSGVDCVIFPDYYMPNGVRKKSAIIIHDLSFISHPQFYSKYFTAYYNYQLKKTLKLKPVIVTVSEHSKKNIGKYLNVKEKDILLVQGYSRLGLNGIPSPRKINDENPYLLYIGHIEPRKNINFMVKGFLNWKERTHSDFKLKIIGELWIRTSSIISLIKEYKNHPDIEFKGYVTESELNEYYANAAGFIHTSFEEGFGFPVLEAMHYNLPLLCSDKIATAEVSGKSSVKIDPLNPISYYSGLEKLSEVIHNQKHVIYEIKYTPEKTLHQLEVLLDRLKVNYIQKYPENILATRTYEEALEKTLLYASIFNCGIRENDLHHQIFDMKLDKLKLKNVIMESLRKGTTIKNNDCLFLNCIEKGFYSQKAVKIVKEKAERLLHFLNKLPFVSMIAFSGGTSHYGILNHNDLDLFIITKPNSVYIVYLFIHLYSFIIRSRKELCANYLIDETNLKISHSYDFYTAHQIITLLPFRNPEMLNKFWNENEWVKQYFPNFNPGTEIVPEHPLKNYLLKPLNLVLLLFYKRLYRKKIISSAGKSSLILKQNCIKLHTNDHKEKIISEFQNRLQDYYRSKRTNTESKLNRKLAAVDF